MCVFAGSLPRGVDPGIYGELIRELRKLNVKTILDTEGEPLRLGVRAEPSVVSPNELEAEELVGHEFNDDADRAEAVVEMTRQGAREAIMTVADGCFARIHENGGPEVVRVRVAEQDARSPIGSGDAFLAGYVAACYTGRGTLEALRFGVACGAESTQHFGAGVIEPGRVQRLLPEVEVEHLRAGAHVG
jgi:1-phosphofructokinase/tagatose 6-phosphate kinase